MKIFAIRFGRAWRIKEGTLKFLTAGAARHPQPLAQCLPTLLPALQICLEDTHPKARKATRHLTSWRWVLDVVCAHVRSTRTHVPSHARVSVPTYPHHANTAHASAGSTRKLARAIRFLIVPCSHIR